MAKPRKVESPEKELRFTRARQAHAFLGIGVLLLCVAAFLAFVEERRGGHP